MRIIRTKKDVTLNASKFDAFISYSRHDEAFVRRLYDALGERERRAWVDWKGIPVSGQPGQGRNPKPVQLGFN